MAPITNILFPVDFSASCVAMAPYVKREATLFGAKVSQCMCSTPPATTVSNFT
jgi:hypothetical protein